MQLKSDGRLGHLEVTKEQPILKPYLKFFYIAYIRLSTDRGLGWGLEPIPWSAVCKYAEFYRLSKPMAEMLFDVIILMDGKYINEKNKYDERHRKTKV
jgi:hypothetical protein